MRICLTATTSPTSQPHNDPIHSISFHGKVKSFGMGISTIAQNILFTPLNRSTSTIRLINILPGDDETISCIFCNFDLVQTPRYKALSYTWGLPAPTKLISIDGKPFYICDNLHQALQILRNKANQAESPEKIFFWIDALSINQEDTLERNHQVDLMSQIYASAEFVLVWLGSETCDTKLVLGIIKDTPKATSIKVRHQYFHDQLSSQLKYNALHAFLCRSYWSRLWIVQETVLAKRIFGMWGLGMWIWQDLERLLNIVAYEQPMSPLLCTPAAQVISRRTSYIGRKSIQKLDHLIIQWTSHGISIEQLGCADPRDRIYGLLGLVERSERGTLGLLRADYNKSAEEIFTTMFAYMRRDSEILRWPTIARLVVLALLQVLGLVIREEVLKKMLDVGFPHVSEDFAAKLREIDAKSRGEYTSKVAAYD